jgi:outer membrane protein OmpA-like peptidoglycan-associated protein
MLRRSRSTLGTRAASFLAGGLSLALLASPGAALAGELGLKVEPGLAFPLGAPQSDRFDIGGGVAGKLLYGLSPSLDLTAGVSYVGLRHASGSPSTEAGTGWGYGVGLQLKRPHDPEASYRMAPWVDADALLVRTGPLNRLGLAAATGLAFSVGETRCTWVGPFVRYEQIFGKGGQGIDGRDAKVLLAGLSVEFGGRRAPRREVAAAPAVVAVAPVPPADRDGDGVPDAEDRCPDVAGPASNQGCPVYQKVVVKPDKLELTEKIQFEWDSPLIEPASHAALDEVVKALQDHRDFRVRLEGHASSEGGEEHNQALSEQRAQAVLDYLASHGVAKERLASKGFSSSVPVETNTTAAGREANRRVEFAVSFIILNPESGK